MTKITIQRSLNALMALILMGIISSAYYQQYFKHEIPCPLCLLQRLGMIGIAMGALLNLRFGIKVQHYAFSLLSAIGGAAVSVRQILLHICPGSPVFGIPVWGLGLYTWAFLSFLCAGLGIIALLFLYNPEQKTQRALNWFEKMAFAAVFVILFANFVTTFMECGFGFCMDVPWPQP